MTSSLICTVIAGRAYVPIDEHNELIQREKRLFDTMEKIAAILNELADAEIKAREEQSG